MFNAQDTVKFMKKEVIHRIEVPKSLVVWILKNITRPIQGYNQKRNERGEEIDVEEQLSETQYQMLLIASDYHRKGYNHRDILRVLSLFMPREKTQNSY